jgi:hypothetical protein
VGIGLALVRRLARLRGGDAPVEDRPGGRGRFILTFAPIGNSPDAPARYTRQAAFDPTSEREAATPSRRLRT